MQCNFVFNDPDHPVQAFGIAVPYTIIVTNFGFAGYLKLFDGGRFSLIHAETICLKIFCFINLQQDLSFLAHVLGVRLQVFRASRAGQSDSLRHHPDEGADHLPLVRLVECAEQSCFYVPVM